METKNSKTIKFYSFLHDKFVLRLMLLLVLIFIQVNLSYGQLSKTQES